MPSLRQSNLPEAQIRVREVKPISGPEGMEWEQVAEVLIAGVPVARLPVTACSWEMGINGISKLRFEVFATHASIQTREPRP